MNTTAGLYNSALHCIESNTTLSQEWCSFGLPVKRGFATELSELALIDEQGNTIACDIRVRNHWHDGSIKWLTIDALLQPGQKAFLSKAPQNKAPTVKSAIPTIDNGLRLSVTELPLSFELNCELQDGGTLTFKPSTPEMRSFSIGNSLKVWLRAEETPYLNIELKITTLHDGSYIDVDLKIGNSNKAVHPNGCWDLGDTNSIQIKRLTLKTVIQNHTKTEIFLCDTLQDAPSPFDGKEIKLTQASSGGENWNSPNHIDAMNTIPLEYRGYRLYSGNDLLSSGNRANPLIKVVSEANSYWYQPEDFWQNFPSQLESSEDRLSWHLFANLTELQPGESKQWRLKIRSTALGNLQSIASSQRLTIRHNPEYLNDTEVFPYIHLSDNARFSALIAKGIYGNQSFLHKREVADEFGWRNFGELYADHEAIGQPKEPTFISHYNNQYDALYGLTVQTLCTQASEWAELAFPLAKHIEDIDIYNTELDKPEYNGGLFWHTDHYLPAATCTHRTYSKVHTSVYDGHQGGGGPGGQHCYTTGLLMHALLYNDETAHDKVLQLSSWIRHFYNGNSSILGRLHRFLTIDLKPNQLTNIGIVQKGYKYPLDRGTGNYIIALLDRFELTGEKALLAEVNFIIRSTAGLADNLTERNLNDVENCWFYTVFLQACIKYLLLKESLNEYDRDYSYTHALLRRFAVWMKENEKPYLDNPDELEFPNDTWAAQEIRKAYIFSFSSYFFSDLENELKEHTQFYTDYIENRLSNSDEAETTRILAILMQGYGGIEKSLRLQRPSQSPAVLQDSDLNSSGRSALVRLLSDLKKSASAFSIRTELNWLSTRFGKQKANEGSIND